MEMGFYRFYFSKGEMGCIVGQKSQVIRKSVCIPKSNHLKYFQLLIFVLALLAGTTAVGQTPGLIIKPATGTGAVLLDPDRDGYVSKKTGGVQLGFQSNDVAESEIPYVAIVRPDPLGDILRGPQGGFTEIVGTDAAGNNAILTYTDGINLYFRFRLSSFAPNSKSYSILVDTDQKFGFTGPNADPNARAGNAGFEVEIVLKTNFSVDVYNVNGLIEGVPLVPEGTYSYETHCQKSIALSRAGDPPDPDYFYDFYIPYPSVFSTSTALRYVATTGMSPSAIMGSGSASDVGGVTLKDMGLDQAFTELINAQTPTVPGAEVLDRTNCPAINGPISSGATSVSGTSADNGATIRLYVNDVQVGSTTVSGGSWTISGLTSLAGGASVKATAQALGKGESSSTCNLTFVGSSCSLIPTVTSIDNGDKGGRIINVSSYPVNTVFTMYNAATNTEWSAPGDNNPYKISSTDIINGRIDIGCGGTGNCLSDGSYYIVAQAPGECESQRAYFCVGSSILASAIPVIDTYIAPLSSYVTGTNGVAGAVLYIYANGTLIGSKTLVSGGAWSVPVPRSSLCSTTLTARQIASAQCISGTSLGVSIGSTVTSAPTISIDKCTTSVTSVTGYSGESDGTLIELFVDGVQRTGTATVSGSKWTFNTSTPITTGQKITARATNSSACKTTSEFSLPVTLSGTTAFTGTYSIPSTVAEGDGTVSVVVSDVSGPYTLNLYIDGDKIGSQSFTVSGTVNVPVIAASIYTGGKLQVSLTQGNQCESALSPVLKIVECNTPSFDNCVISTPLNKKCVTTSGVITITNSQTGVIYTPVDASGIVKGYSTLGTGGTIAVTTYAFPTSGPAIFYVKAQRIVPSGTCEARSTASVSFNAFSPPQFTVHPANKVVCSGESTSFTASWSGIGPFNVKWQYNNGGGYTDINNGGIYSGATVTGITTTSATLNISNVSGLDNYSFQCIVADTSVPSECQSSTSYASTLTVPLVTISNALVANATLGNNGSINITVSGGTAPYRYDWHHLNGEGTFGELEDLTGLAEGVYTVTVQDANGCTYQQAFTVGGINSINLALGPKTDITCYGANNGSFTVNATSGTPPYSYSIDNFAHIESSGNFTNLPAGSYTVKARDANMKPSNTVQVNITEPAEIVVSAVVSNPSVLLDDGSVTFTVEGGTPNFNYIFKKNGSAEILGTNYSNLGRTKSYSNLTAGTYSLSVSDANGCVVNKTNIVLTAPLVTTQSCLHYARHSFNGAQAKYEGFDGEFNYFNSEWKEGGDANNNIQINKEAMGLGVIPAITTTSNQPVTLIGNPSVTREIDLTGVDLSTVTISYKYSVDNPSGKDDYGVRFYVNNVIVATHYQNVYNGISGSVSLPVSGQPISFTNGINTFRFELYKPGGKYEAQSNILIDDFQVSFTKLIRIGLITTPSTCDNGKIALSVTGGYPPYEYDWDKDEYDGKNLLTKLAPGNYKVYVKDRSKNCTSQQLTATIDPAPLEASISSRNPTCVGGGSNGSVTATVTQAGGGGPYLYELYKGASEFKLIVFSAASSHTFNGLTAGTYSVKVIQADNCNYQTSPETLIMPVFTSEIVSTGSTSICSGSSTTLAVNILGGTSPFTVLLSDGQSVTNYTSGSAITVTPNNSTTYTVVSVVDASSCVSSYNAGAVAVTVNPVMPVSVNITASPSNAICSVMPVTFTATPVNAGTLPVYQWKRNGMNVGTNSTTYTYTPANGDVITCVLTSNVGCATGNPAVSNAITMRVDLPVGGTLSGGNSPLCLGAQTGTMTLNGYTGNIVRWERQINSGGWVNVYNAGNTTYSELPWSAGLWEYRVVVQSGSCLVYSDVKAIAVDPITVSGWISGSSTPLCEGFSTGTMTLNGSTGNIVRWEKRLAEGTWINISHTNPTYSEIPASAGKWEYRVLVQSGSCLPVYSSSFSVTVNPTLTISLGPNPSVCRGTSTATISYTATTGDPKGYSIDFDAAANSAGFADVSGWALPAGAITVNVPWNVNSGVYHGSLTVLTYYPACSSISYPITIEVSYFSDLSGFNITTPDICRESNAVLTVGSSSLPNGTYTVNYNLSGSNVLTGMDATMVVTGNNTGTFNTPVLLNTGSTTVRINSLSSGVCTIVPASGNETSFMVNNNQPVAAFSYTGSPYCLNDENPMPAFESGGYAGTFSSSEGLVFVSNATGQINLALSTPGTYTVTNVILEDCGTSTFDAQVTILPPGSWTGDVDQDWNNAGNWICNMIPTLETNVLIANGKPRYPVLSAGDAGMAHHITIEKDASVKVMYNTLQIAGAIHNSGTFTATEGTIEMKGSDAQTIGAEVFYTNTLMNLTIDNPSGVTLQGALNITGIVKAVMGDLHSGGRLTLLSTKDQTALIDGSGSGNVTGTVNMQRYLPKAFGYKYFSSPFRSATVAEFADEMDLTEAFPTFYKYDENHSRDSLDITVYYTGWTKYTDPSYPLNPMFGYAANMGTGTDPITVTMSGEVNNGDLSIPLYNNNRKYTKGFNLVGNPYPSPIDWDATQGWTRENIDGSVYFFNAGTERYSGTYTSYVNGQSTGDGDNIIAAMQGFFVHVSKIYPLEGKLGVTNSVRVNNLNPVFKKALIDPRPTLRLTAGFELKGAIEDAAVVYFDPLAVNDFEQDKDALKLNNTDVQVPNIYTLSPDGRELSINGLSFASDSLITIPVGITTYIPGWINLRAGNVKDLSSFEQVILKDAVTGRLHDLRRSPDVRFYLDKGKYDRRFSLIFSNGPMKGPVLERLFTVVRSGNSVMIKVNLESNTMGSLMVTNVLGQALLRKEVFEKETVELSQGTGVYVITLVSGKRTVSEKILMRTDYE